MREILKISLKINRSKNVYGIQRTNSFLRFILLYIKEHLMKLLPKVVTFNFFLLFSSKYPYFLADMISRFIKNQAR